VGGIAAGLDHNCILFVRFFTCLRWQGIPVASTRQACGLGLNAKAQGFRLLRVLSRWVSRLRLLCFCLHDLCNVGGKTCCSPPDVFSAGHWVAQIPNLLYRRFPIGWRFGYSRRQGSGVGGRIEFCDTADWKSALRARGMRVRSCPAGAGFGEVLWRGGDSAP
jgi:hypothetical protein